MLRTLRAIIAIPRTRSDGKAGVSYKITNHVMVYADWAQGFRPGGSNAGYVPKCYNNGVPQSYTPDTLNNYEFGWKTTSQGGRLLWNGATYFMDWKELQALIYNADVCASSSYNINVGNARIYGAESNVDYKIDENLTLQASVNYTDARVTTASSPAYDSYVNERLPFSPYFSWSWNAPVPEAHQQRSAGLPAVRHDRQRRHVQRSQSQRRKHRIASHPAALLPPHEFASGYQPRVKRGSRSSTSPISRTRTRSSTATRGTSTCG